ncbi:hypothetical protein F5050DRAFT_1710059 [Lentinula boryana]|uniref:Uncharacterized protein n=1 Tax=Lentinula boryana TaxID=40481 RepID=A0ABQ8QK92_9AGAR|nr:hypothetical protein F5050DRAFT_1710059 [Lentinula boryana]
MSKVMWFVLTDAVWLVQCMVIGKWGAPLRLFQSSWLIHEHTPQSRYKGWNSPTATISQLFLSTSSEACHLSYFPDIHLWTDMTKLDDPVNNGKSGLNLVIREVIDKGHGDPV